MKMGSYAALSHCCAAVLAFAHHVDLTMIIEYLAPTRTALDGRNDRMARSLSRRVKPRPQLANIKTCLIGGIDLG